MKVLVLAAEPVSAESLRDALGPGSGDADVLVISPAMTHSRMRFLVSDADEAIEHARQTQEKTVENLRENEIDASGDTGESDPMLAIEDALAEFTADRIVLFTHPEDDRDHLEDSLDDAEQRFGLPVIRVVLPRRAR